MRLGMFVAHRDYCEQNYLMKLNALRGSYSCRLRYSEAASTNYLQVRIKYSLRITNTVSSYLHSTEHCIFPDERQLSYAQHTKFRSTVDQECNDSSLGHRP